MILNTVGTLNNKNSLKYERIIIYSQILLLVFCMKILYILLKNINSQFIDQHISILERTR